MIRRPPRSTHCISSAASDVYKRQILWRFIQAYLGLGRLIISNYLVQQIDVQLQIRNIRVLLRIKLVNQPTKSSSKYILALPFYAAQGILNISQDQLGQFVVCADFFQQYDIVNEFYQYSWNIQDPCTLR
eukprot:TRINITY_DN20384_c0_g1_i3.p2 TRINITY_DN20384_c0_g1~~TRINITY_DN20384_c0_g1_i3.p2  ORF type:complete len:130 (-),score=22.66 TRINITY_DN20384_c0_g1_i3:134-523(-)